MKKFLIGCGVLTGVAVLLIAVGSFFAVRWVKENAPDLERLENYEQQMLEEFGQAREFVPPLDGVYDAERIRLYARLRQGIFDDSAELRGRIDAEIADTSEGASGIRGFFSNVKKGATYVRSSFEYIADADSILLDAGMGRGEYVHYTGLLLRGGIGVDLTEFMDVDLPEDEQSAFEAIALEFEDESRKLVLDQWDNLLRTSRDEAWTEAVREQVGRTRRRESPWPFVRSDLPPSLTDVFAEVRSTLENTKPRSAGALLLENVLGATVDDEGGGMQIKFD